MSVIVADGFEFDFPQALKVYKFDEDNPAIPIFRGSCEMKGVDIIAEFNSAYLFVEMKDFFDPIANQVRQPKPTLQSDLKYKYRDSFLYQYAHNMVDKPIIYICLMEHLDSAMMTHLSSYLGKIIPDNNHLPSGWVNGYLESAIVVDVRKWNQSLSRWGKVKQVVRNP